MPRRSLLSATDLTNLLALPEDDDEFIRRYTLSGTDLALIRQRRGAANRLGFAIQLCYMRYPGLMLTVETQPSERLLRLVAGQLKTDPTAWKEYGQRAETRREHVLELQAVFGFRSFTNKDVGNAVHSLQELAMQSDKGIVLAEALVTYLRQQRILLPSLGVIERVCAEAVTTANRRIYAMLTSDVTSAHRARLDALLKRREDGKATMLTWLRQSPAKANSRHMLEHIDRLRAWQALQLPAGIERQVHQNRLLKMAREGAQMIAADLAKFEPERRYATLVALAVEGTATVIDEIIELHDRIMGQLFSVAKRKHQEQFHASGKAINAKVRLYGQIGQALLEAKRSGGDALAK